MIEETADELLEPTIEKPAEVIMPTNYKPLSKSLKIFYGIGDFGFTLMSNVETYYFMFFLTNFAMFDPAIAAVISTVGSTIDAIVGWMLGGFLNAIKPMKWGRYRSWLLFAPWIVPVLFALEYTVISENVVLSATLITFFYVMAHIAWDFPYVSNVTMVAVAGKTPEDRAQLASTRAMWANASKIIFSYVFPPVALLGAQLFGETNQYAFAALVFGCVFAAFYNIHFRLLKGYEKEYSEEELKNWKQTKKENKDRNTFGDMMRALIKNPSLISLLLSDISKWVFNFTVAGIAVYYFTYVVFEPALLATYIFISNVLCVVGAYVSSPLIKITRSSKNNCIFAFVLMLVMLLLARIDYTNMWLAIVLLSIAQFGYGIIYSSIAALYGDCVVYSEWKTGKNSAGWISGLQLAPLKLGFVARGMVIPAILAAVGFVAGMDPADSTLALQEGIANGFMVMPAILLAVSALLLIFGFRLTPKKLKEYQAEIDARRDASE